MRSDCGPRAEKGLVGLDKNWPLEKWLIIYRNRSAIREFEDMSGSRGGEFLALVCTLEWLFLSGNVSAISNFGKFGFFLFFEGFAIVNGVRIECSLKYFKSSITQAKMRHI